MRHLQSGQERGRGAAEGKRPRRSLFLPLHPVAGSLATLYWEKSREVYMCVRVQWGLWSWVGDLKAPSRISDKKQWGLKNHQVT